jgi:hypothetical protein
MANAQNMRSAALPPAVHPHRSRIPLAPKAPDVAPLRVAPPPPSGTRTSRPPAHVDDPWSSVPSVQIEADEGDTIVRSYDSVPVPASRSPISPTREAHDMVRAAVVEALGPVRERMDDLERGMLETIVRVAKAPPSTASRSPIATREAHDMMRLAVEEAVAPLRSRLDELERGMHETIARVVNATASDDAALRTDRGGRERRLIMLLVAGLLVLNVATLFGVLTHNL